MLPICLLPTYLFMIHPRKPGKWPLNLRRACLSEFPYSKSNRYSQTATGMIPEDRGKFCAVGVEDADNFTYEM